MSGIEEKRREGDERKEKRGRRRRRKEEGEEREKKGEGEGEERKEKREKRGRRRGGGRKEKREKRGRRRGRREEGEEGEERKEKREVDQWGGHESLYIECDQIDLRICLFVSPALLPHVACCSFLCRPAPVVSQSCQLCNQVVWGHFSWQILLFCFFLKTLTECIR